MGAGGNIGWGGSGKPPGAQICYVFVKMLEPGRGFSPRPEDRLLLRPAATPKQLKYVMFSIVFKPGAGSLPGERTSLLRQRGAP